METTQILDVDTSKYTATHIRFDPHLISYHAELVMMALSMLNAK